MPKIRSFGEAGVQMYFARLQGARKGDEIEMNAEPPAS